MRVLGQDAGYGQKNAFITSYSDDRYRVLAMKEYMGCDGLLACPIPIATTAPAIAVITVETATSAAMAVLLITVVVP